MADESRRENNTSGQGSSREGGGAQSAGDPGRTPGKAEGDEQTVDESLERQGQGQKQ